MLRVERVSLERFETSRPEWDRLLGLMPRPAPFSTWEWIHTWWRHFGRTYELFVLFVRRGEELVGILPLASSVAWIEGAILPGRILSHCGSRELDADHVDLIAAEKDAPDCWAAILAFLEREHRAWDVLHLPHVSEESSVARFARGASTPFPTHVRQVSASPYIVLGGTFDEYRATLSRQSRSKLKRARTMVREQLGLVYDAPRGGTIAGAIEEAFELQNRRADRKGVRSRFRGTPLVRFHSDVASLFQEEGRLRLRFLRYGGKPIAFWYCYALQGRYYAYQQGFDPEWGDRKVATVLLYDLIEEACREGARELDLLRGRSPFKERWTEVHRALLDVTFYNTTFLGISIGRSIRLRERLARTAKRLLRRGA